MIAVATLVLGFVIGLAVGVRVTAHRYQRALQRTIVNTARVLRERQMSR